MFSTVCHNYCRYLSGTICIFLWFCCGCQAIKPTNYDQYIRPDLDKDWHVVFDEYRESIPKAMKGSKIPGLSISLVDQEGIIWMAGFGHTDYDCRTPITSDTFFSIQSISKAVTTVIALCAVQDGLVDLDTPITEYIPNFTINSIFEDDPQDKITLRHLLTHRAGLIHEAPVGNNNEPDCSSFQAHIDSISDTWLKHKVGTDWSYSNLGMDLVAYILEVKSGKPFAAYLQERLFNPLGMAHSSANREFIKNNPNRAVGHMPYVKNADDYMIPMTGAGGVYTSVSDFSKFVQLFLDGPDNKQRVVERELLDEMHKGWYVTRGGKAGIQGLGIIFRTDGGNKLDENDSGLSGPFWGGGFGYNSFSAWSYDYGIGVMVFTNKGGHNQNETIALDIIHKLIQRGIVKKNISPDIIKWIKASYLTDEGKKQKKVDSDTFTPYDTRWKNFLGTYNYIESWELSLIARIGKLLGIWQPPKIVIYEKDGYLVIDGKRLDEHRNNVFLTEYGQCLDFSGPVPVWNGLRIKKK